MNGYVVFSCLPDLNYNKSSAYSEKEDQLAEAFKHAKNGEGWWMTLDQQFLFTTKMMQVLLKEIHKEIHVEQML